ncbi:hypothetical protein LCGC14_1263480 [marine sediment metagenome]|uniref:Uncharacterized protein n=1 Tax=marine sediment metagenome TaxID=412755 RepID=A0A0F9P3E7_9ZZZZ
MPGKEINDDFSFADFMKVFEPIPIGLKKILRTIDLNAVAELLEGCIQFIKSVELSRDEILEMLEFYKEH